MTNQKRFFTNLKIMMAVRKRDRLQAMSPVSDAAITKMDKNIKTLENSLKDDA